MVNRLRNADTPYLADWFAISLRWLIVIGLSISLGLSGTLDLTVVGLLSIPILWNGFMAALAIFNRRLSQHRVINLVIDLIFCLSLFHVTGGLGGAVIWIALLPIVTAAVYYEIRGTLLITILVTAGQVFSLFQIDMQNLQPLPIATLFGYNILAAAGATALTLPLVARLRTSYHGQVSLRKESERRVQRQERDRMRALFSMIETFSSTLNYQKVLEIALEASVAAITTGQEEGDQMVGGVLLFDDQDLEIKANYRFYPRDLSARFAANEGVLGESLKCGEARLITNPSQDPELNQLLTLNDHNVALCIPLLRGMNAYGVLLFAHKRADFFSQDRIDILQMVSNQAVISIQNARLYQDLTREKERLVQTQEEAQKKLARDLHDGPTQTISAIAMRISIARKILERSPKDAADELMRVEELARRTTQEIRHMLFTLRPLVLETEGLVAALKTMAEKINEVYQQRVFVDADPLVVEKMDASYQTVVFSLAEEAVSNARKHAEASEIWVRIKHPGNEQSVAVLEIADNGVGFDVHSVLGAYERRGSLGMVNLRERAELVNGLLKIDSLPGKGTRVRVFIPLTEEAADRLHQGR